MKGEIYSKTPVSDYQPSQEVIDLTCKVKYTWSAGDEILNHSYVELNNLSPIDRDNRDKRTFNAFVDEYIEDPDEAWKWRGTRSKARNKAVAMHAQLTFGYIVPMFMAQNENDEEDRAFSDVMRDCAEWLVYNSNYKTSYLMASMGMLVNCVTYMGAEYAEVFQKIKEKTENGYTVTEILDEVHSGFQAPVYSSDEILISNAFEQNIQKQKGIIKRRYIEYSDAKAKYGDHENFKYVKAGWRSVYSEADGVFYDVKDDEHPTLVEEATAMYRTDDLEVCFLGGIYMGDSDTNANPMKHRDNRNAPKYNIVPLGYQRISEHFFFFKSLMNAQYYDNILLDAQYEVGMNRIFLDTEMPLAVTGIDKISTDITFPGAITAFESKDVDVKNILPPSDMSKIFNGMSAVENSMDESSISDTSGGQLPERDQKATAISIAERNAQINIKSVGKNLAEFIVQYGGLMSDIIAQHFSAAQVDQIVGDSVRLRYRSFVLKDKAVDGKNVSKIIRFDESLLGKEMTKNEKEYEEIKMLEATGYPESKEVIYRVNPERFSRMKYLTRVEPETMFAKNQEFMQAMYLQIMTQFQNNPYVELEALTRKTLYQFFRGETDEIMKKQDIGMDKMSSILGGEEESNPTMAGKKALNRGLSTGIPKTVGV